MPTSLNMRNCFVLYWLFAGATASVAPATWFKASTHTHTLNSDGGATPDFV